MAVVTCQLAAALRLQRTLGRLSGRDDELAALRAAIDLVGWWFVDDGAGVNTRRGWRVRHRPHASARVLRRIFLLLFSSCRVGIR